MPWIAFYHFIGENGKIIHPAGKTYFHILFALSEA